MAKKQKVTKTEEYVAYTIDEDKTPEENRVEALEQLAEAKEKLDSVPIEELKEIANWPLDSDSTEDVVMVGNTKVWEPPVENNDTLVPIPNYILQPTYELTGNLKEEGAQEKLDEVIEEFKKKNKDNEDALYRAMVEDGLIIDASEEVLPNMDDEWAKYLEEHAASLPPVEDVVRPFAGEPTPTEIPKRVSPIQFKQPVKPASPPTVPAKQGVAGVNRPRFMGGR